MSLPQLEPSELDDRGRRSEEPVGSHGVELVLEAKLVVLLSPSLLEQALGQVDGLLCDLLILYRKFLLGAGLHGLGAGRRFGRRGGVLLQGWGDETGDLPLILSLFI